MGSSGLIDISTTVFLDNGCSGFALMDKDFATLHKIPVVASDTTYTVSLANGSSGGMIQTQTTPLTLKLGSHSEQVCFLLTSLSTPITLGLPWMRLHNPLVNWRSLTLTFSDDSCIKLGHLTSLPSALPLENAMGLHDSLDISTLDAVLPPSDLPTTQSSTGTDIVNAADFLKYAQEHKLDISIAHLDYQPSGSSPTVSIRAVLLNKEYTKSSLSLDSRGVPLKYQDFSDVFTMKTEPPPGLPPH